MHLIDDDTPVSGLLAIKLGDLVAYRSLSGVVNNIDFEESNTFWEIIYTLISNEKIYIRKQKTNC